MRRKLEVRLLEWKARKHHKPLLLSGARKTGKTHLLMKFGKDHFRHTLYVDFESNAIAAALVGRDPGPASFMRFLESGTLSEISPEGSLIILDGLHASEGALRLLLRFGEEAPVFSVIGATSFPLLTGAELMPGNVDTLRLYPLDFEEYLWARGEAELSAEIRNAFEVQKPLEASMHCSALGLYHEYISVGGMPREVCAFLDGHEVIPRDTGADIARYSSPSGIGRIRTLYEAIPRQLGKIIPCDKKEGAASSSVDWLVMSGLALRSQRLSLLRAPFIAYCDDSALKLYMPDLGLLSNNRGLTTSALAENYVALQLAVGRHPLYHWEGKGEAKADFIILRKDMITGINVGEEGIDPRHSGGERHIRLSGDNFGDDHGIVTIPVYAAFCL